MLRTAALVALLASPAAAQDIVVHYTMQEAQAQADADNAAIKALGYPASQTIGGLIEKLQSAVKTAQSSPPESPARRPPR